MDRMMSIINDSFYIPKVTVLELFKQDILE